MHVGRGDAGGSLSHGAWVAVYSCDPGMSPGSFIYPSSAQAGDVVHGSNVLGPAAGFCGFEAPSERMGFGEPSLSILVGCAGLLLARGTV